MIWALSQVLVKFSFSEEWWLKVFKLPRLWCLSESICVPHFLVRSSHAAWNAFSGKGGSLRDVRLKKKRRNWKIGNHSLKRELGASLRTWLLPYTKVSLVYSLNYSTLLACMSWNPSKCKFMYFIKHWKTFTTISCLGNANESYYIPIRMAEI